MAAKTIAVLDPTAKPRIKEVSMVPRPSDLNGKVLGFLWNNKPNGDLLLLRIKELLSRRFCFSGTNWRQKPAATVAAEAVTLEELANTSDLVINAVGD